VNNFGFTDAPALLDLIGDVRRSSPVAQFTSKFRSRRAPLPALISKQVIEAYEKFRREGAAVAKTYVDALPSPPPLVDPDRTATYERLLGRTLVFSSKD
jgi:hypothetical protein